MKTKQLAFILSLVLSVTLGMKTKAQVAISVNFAPPAIPTYNQPMPPSDGYIWIPGYWAYNNDGGYYWVPGYWTLPPQPGLYWTPGYWAFNGGNYVWNRGYWGDRVGYYGGINYGFGYFGSGFVGGMWKGNTYVYNTAVTRVNTTVIHNTYVDNNFTDNHNRYSYNGRGGTNAKPNNNERQMMNQPHTAATDFQKNQHQMAHNNPEMHFTNANSAPPQAAVDRHFAQMRNPGGPGNAPHMGGNQPHPAQPRPQAPHNEGGNRGGGEHERR